MKVPAFHSTNPSDPDVFHDEGTCSRGKLIPSYNRADGTGGYRKCETCKQISG